MNQRYEYYIALSSYRVIIPFQRNDVVITSLCRMSPHTAHPKGYVILHTLKVMHNKETYLFRN